MAQELFAEKALNYFKQFLASALKLPAQKIDAQAPFEQYGIDSVMLPRAPREQAWRRLAQDLPLALLDTMIVEAKLADLPELAPKILKGQVRGRVVVDVGR